MKGIRQLLFGLIACCIPLMAVGSYHIPSIVLEKAHIDPHDRASILRGAKFFAANCMACHSMKYLRHDRLAKEAGVTLDKMPLDPARWTGGSVPPDLTLIAKQKTADWIYTYLHVFYKDPSQPLGSNNLLTANVNMPNVLIGFQGTQVLITNEKTNNNGGVFRKRRYYSILKRTEPGSMTPEQFDETTRDLVNFFVYAGDPEVAYRRKLGIWVLLFFVVLGVLAYLLKKSYWKDV